MVAFVYILGILFWVLCALAVVCLIVLTFAYVEGKRKTKESDLVSTVYAAVMEQLEKAENSKK